MRFHCGYLVPIRVLRLVNGCLVNAGKNVSESEAISLDFSRLTHIIQRNIVKTMNTYSFALVLVVILAVLIIKGQFVVGWQR